MNHLSPKERGGILSPAALGSTYGLLSITADPDSTSKIPT